MKQWMVWCLVCLMAGVQAQQMKIAAKAVPGQNEIITTVTLLNVPVNGRMRYQQRLPQQVSVKDTHLKGLQWDTADNILTCMALQTIAIDSFSFSFTVQYAGAGKNITWGEAALMYETSDSSVQKLSHSASLLMLECEQPVPTQEGRVVVSEWGEVKKLSADTVCPITDADNVYYVQVSASRSQQSVTELKRMACMQSGDNMYEMKDNKYYCYRIGPYYAKETATEKLKYYKTRFKDAFIVKK